MVHPVYPGQPLLLLLLLWGFDVRLFGVQAKSPTTNPPTANPPPLCRLHFRSLYCVLLDQRRLSFNHYSCSRSSRLAKATGTELICFSKAHSSRVVGVLSWGRLAFPPSVCLSVCVRACAWVNESASGLVSCV